MVRIGRKPKAGTGENKRERIGSGGFGTCYGRGRQSPKARIPVPDENVITHPSSTNAIPIPTAPVVIPEQRNYLTPFISRHSKKNANAISSTLEMQPNEYCVFLTSMAKHTSKSQLPNLVVKISLNLICVTIELSTTIFNELTVSAT
jgi:hypothetical protein